MMSIYPSEISKFQCLFMKRVRNGNSIECVEKYLIAGVDPRMRYGNGESTLHAAIHNDKMIELLLRYGADPNAAKDDGMTSLMAAMEPPIYHESAVLLIAAGADVGARNSHGLCAIELMDRALAQLRLPYVIDPTGWALAEMAPESRQRKLVELRRALTLA